MKFFIIFFIIFHNINNYPIYPQTNNFTDAEMSDSAHYNSNAEWSINIALGGSYQSGNTNKSVVNGKGKIERTDKKLETILAASYLYGTKNGSKDNNNLSAILTADYNYKKIFSPFFLQIFEYDYSKGIDARSQTGGGAKYLFYSDKNEMNVSSVSLALIYDYTNLLNDPENYRTDRTRFSLRLKTSNSILDSHLIISGIAFFQPAVDNFSENNQRYEVKMSIPIVKKFRFFGNYLYSKDDVVTVGRKRVDIFVTFGLEYTFGK